MTIHDLINLEELRNTDLWGALFALTVGTTFALRSEAVGDPRSLKWVRFAAVVNAVGAITIVLWMILALLLRVLIAFGIG